MLSSLFIFIHLLQQSYKQHLYESLVESIKFLQLSVVSSGCLHDVFIFDYSGVISISRFSSCRVDSATQNYSISARVRLTPKPANFNEISEYKCLNRGVHLPYYSVFLY